MRKSNFAAWSAWLLAGALAAGPARSEGKNPIQDAAKNAERSVGGAFKGFGHKVEEAATTVGAAIRKPEKKSSDKSAEKRADKGSKEDRR